MLFALSTGHAIGLAVTGAAFIAFSLISFFVLAGRNPNFPGSRGLRWYLPLCGVFFLAMMAAVLYFGREPKGEASATPENTGATTASSTPASTPATGTAPAG